jgi:hypothetical protein
MLTRLHLSAVLLNSLFLFILLNMPIAWAERLPLNGQLSQPQPLLAEVSPPVSPSDFKNKVRKMGEKTREELANQFQQDVSRQPQPKVTEPPKAAAEAPPGSETSITQAVPETETSSPAGTLVPGKTASPGATPTNASPSGFGNQAGTGNTTQTQIYTGFGQGTTAPGAAPPPPPPASSPAQSGPGWNIKY